MTGQPAPNKRVASEPASALFEREAERTTPLPRPNSIVGGVALIAMRAIAAVAWTIGLVREWPEIVPELELDDTGEYAEQMSNLILGTIVGFEIVWVLTLLCFAWLVFRGNNIARFLVQLGTAGSIAFAAVSYFVLGEEITIRTTLITLAIDILILLALTSRASREWTRQRASLRRAQRLARRELNTR